MSVCRSEAAEPARALDLDWEAEMAQAGVGALPHTRFSQWICGDREAPLAAGAKKDKIDTSGNAQALAKERPPRNRPAAPACKIGRVVLLESPHAHNR